MPPHLLTSFAHSLLIKFLELETLVLKGKVEAKLRFEKIIKLLELDISKQIKKSYRDLLLKS